MGHVMNEGKYDVVMLKVSTSSCRISLGILF